MTTELSVFAARLRGHIAFWSDEFSLEETLNHPAYQQHADIEFSGLAVMLFTLQFKHNTAYRQLCEARGIKPGDVHHWTQIPAVPTAAFKELELTCLHPEDRLQVFHSSGTTEQRPSRHFHNADSLALYEASLWPWFVTSLQVPLSEFRWLILTPPAKQTPHSSLVHMFDFISRQTGAGAEVFVGQVTQDGSWALDFNSVQAVLAAPDAKPLFVLGTAFSFVHLLDEMIARNQRLQLPAGSWVLETGGYKGRSRTMPKVELHRLITERLGVVPQNILCEYGMSELSSQAYDSIVPGINPVCALEQGQTRCFHFPPWARARVISPESRKEGDEGEVGLLQIFDLANAFSVMAIQTEDLAMRRGTGFELVGRAALSESRGCSLLSTDS